MTNFTINNFPVYLEVNDIMNEQLPYAKKIKSEMQFEPREFHEAYDFSERSQFKTHDKEKDGFIEVASNRSHNK